MIHTIGQNLYTWKKILLWSILSFKAGMLNAAGFLFAGYFVSHVTGFGTQIGITIGHEEYAFGIELLVIPVSFILGGFVTSLILDVDYDEKKIPRYDYVQLLITTMLGVISILFLIDFYDSSVLPMKHDDNTIFLIALLCFVCGLKNGLSTWSTSGKIRTTHLTGLSTDIGLHLPKVVLGRSFNSRFPEEKIVTYTRLITLLSFSLGSFFSAMFIHKLGEMIFYVSFMISIGLLYISITNRKRLVKLSKGA